MVVLGAHFDLFEHDVDDLYQLRPPQRLKDQYLVYTVEELRTERLFGGLDDRIPHAPGVCGALFFRPAEAEGASAHIVRDADIARHDHDTVPEIADVAVAVR